MIDTFLSELYETGLAHDATQNDRSTKRLNITPETGAFLALLLLEAQPRSILEIGTSNGYSTIWIARAAKSIEAQVVTLDALEEKTNLARNNLTRVGLADTVQLVTADAGSYLEETEDRSFDFVFLDAYRHLYESWWPKLRRILDWGILVVDNALSHPDEMHSLVQLVRSDAELDQVVLPIGKGQLIVTNKKLTKEE